MRVKNEFIAKLKFSRVRVKAGVSQSQLVSASINNVNRE